MAVEKQQNELNTSVELVIIPHIRELNGMSLSATKTIQASKKNALNNNFKSQKFIDVF